ncbi:hypothetical protein NVP1121O_228 [Vibrio phage 1.121.O._10N.286.46.C4]|nr:hypothetical protein NVP1121O_228 [Vibrio phage 1.121.O._10N.286.46.C4]
MQEWEDVFMDEAELQEVVSTFMEEVVGEIL